MEKAYTGNEPFVLVALAEGQEKAYDYIFRKHYKALCAQANAYVSDPDLAQSLVQECFIRLWEKRRKATSIDNLSSYLSFMVRNICIDHLRKEQRLKSFDHKLPERPDSQQSDTLVLSREFEEKMVAALATLPGRCRMAFEYSRFENMTYAEIAKEMNISVKAVEGLISRSLKLLRSELKDYLPIIIILYKMIH